ncbi:hypothetical protein [Sphingomonas sp.]|uniref:hypothetical protein n=1 Tax=Sphingomonas sp. TaxID=28214 RepID=UPI001EBF68CA|nr:hypothetical protein [Sphingomonas sp.]MBX3593452.1 hypothetical protein [Sphingomonas sp.]
MIRALSIIASAVAILLAPAAQAQVMIAPFGVVAYLNSACLSDPNEANFETRARACAEQHAALKKEMDPYVRIYAPGNAREVFKRMDGLFAEQERAARTRANGGEELTVLYSDHLRCLANAMRGDREFRRGNGFPVARVRESCPETRARLLAQDGTDADRRSIAALDRVETRGWTAGDYGPSTNFKQGAFAPGGVW